MALRAGGVPLGLLAEMKQKFSNQRVGVTQRLLSPAFACWSSLGHGVLCLDSSFRPWPDWASFHPARRCSGAGRHGHSA